MIDSIFLIINSISAPILFLLVLVVEAGVPVPIPYDILILAAGFQKINLFEIMAPVVIGNLIGSSILYYISLRLGHPFLHKGSKFLGVSESRLKMIEKWFNRWGGFAIILARLIPGARFAATCLSGVFSLPYFRVFLPNLFIGSVFWVVSYWFVGAIVGDGIHLIGNILGVWSVILMVIVVALTALAIFRIYHKLNGGQN